MKWVSWIKNISELVTAFDKNINRNAIIYSEPGSYYFRLIVYGQTLTSFSTFYKEKGREAAVFFNIRYHCL